VEDVEENVDLDVVDVVDAEETVDVEAVVALAPEADAETRKREEPGSP